MELTANGVWLEAVGKAGSESAWMDLRADAVVVGPVSGFPSVATEGPAVGVDEEDAVVANVRPTAPPASEVRAAGAAAANVHSAVGAAAAVVDPAVMVDLGPAMIPDNGPHHWISNQAAIKGESSARSAENTAQDQGGAEQFTLNRHDNALSLVLFGSQHTLRKRLLSSPPRPAGVRRPLPFSIRRTTYVLTNAAHHCAQYRGAGETLCLRCAGPG
jgi:hypothetical protein